METYIIGNERRDAEHALTEIDAEVASWFVYDGQLSERPLDGALSAVGRSLRVRRLAAVARLEAAGGRDPNPCFLREPTQAQRDGWQERRGRGLSDDPIRFLLDGLGVANLAELRHLVDAGRDPG